MFRPSLLQRQSQQEQSIGISPPPPFIPHHQKQHQQQSSIYQSSSSTALPITTTNHGDLIKHDISTLVSLKAQQIDELEEKLEKANRDLKQSDELRLRWMERCSLLEEQLVEEAQNHTKELARANQAGVRYKSELQFVLSKLQEDEIQAEFLASIGATRLLEDVVSARNNKNKKRDFNHDHLQHSSSNNEDELFINNSNHRDDGTLSISNFFRDRFSTSPSRMLLLSNQQQQHENDNSSMKPGIETSTSISPSRFKSPSPKRRRNHKQEESIGTQQNQQHYSPSQIFQHRPNHFYPPKTKTAENLNDALEKLLLIDEERRRFNEAQNENKSANIRIHHHNNQQPKKPSSSTTVLFDQRKDSANCFSPIADDEDDQDDFEENEAWKNNNNNKNFPSSPLFLGHQVPDRRNLSPSRTMSILQERAARGKSKSPTKRSAEPTIQWIERPKPKTEDASTNSEPLPQKVNFFTQVEEAYFPHQVSPQLVEEKIFTDTKMQTDMVPQKSAALQTEDLRRMRAQETQTNSYDTEADRELERMKRFVGKLKADDERRAKRDEEIRRNRNRTTTNRNSSSSGGGGGGKRRKTTGGRSNNDNNDGSFQVDLGGFFDEDENGDEEGSNGYASQDDDQSQSDSGKENQQQQQNQDASVSFWHRALLSSPDAKQQQLLENNGTRKIRTGNFAAHSPSRAAAASILFFNANNNTPQNQRDLVHSDNNQSRNQELMMNNRDRLQQQNQFTVKPQDLNAELLELRATVQILKKELLDAKRENFNYREKMRKMNLVESM